MPNGQETRVVDEKTGGAKGSKLARFDLIPWRIIYEVAEHFGRGARKYDERNWERGYAWSLSFAALHRHLEAFWNRDDIDDDPSLYEEGERHVVRHITAVVWHALVLAYFSRFGVGTDDRPGLYITDTTLENAYVNECAADPGPQPGPDDDIAAEFERGYYHGVTATVAELQRTFFTPKVRRRWFW